MILGFMSARSRAASPASRLLSSVSRAQSAKGSFPLSRVRSVMLRMLSGALAIGMIAPAWAAQGTWVGQLPHQTIVVSERPLESTPIPLPPSMDRAEIGRVRWIFHTDTQAPTLNVWLCQGQRCLPLVGSRGETQHFAGGSASMPFRLRYQWPPGEQTSGRRVMSGGQLIIDYRQADKQPK